MNYLDYGIWAREFIGLGDKDVLVMFNNVIIPVANIVS
jgi:hypothetical protein